MFTWENISRLWSYFWGKKVENEPSTEEFIQDLQSTKVEVNAQFLLERTFPIPEDKVNCQLLNLKTKNENNPHGLEVKLTGPLDLTGFTNLKALGCRGHQITNLNLLDCLQLEELYCWGNELTELDLINCSRLKTLSCGFNKLTNLDLTGLEELENVQCNDNYLENFDYSTLNPEKITLLNVTTNNLSEQDLSIFNKFANLELLWIGNDNEKHTQQNIYNKFHGSLEPLKNLTKLRSLRISNTDIDNGLEYLPPNLEEIYCSSQERPNCGVKNIAEQLNNSADFILWDEKVGRYIKKQQVQAWLELTYSTSEDKASCQSINIVVKDENNHQGIPRNYLSGPLTLKGFNNLKGFGCSEQKITGLNLQDCSQLENLQCWDNELTGLDLSNCSELKRLGCSGNKLTNLEIKSSNLTMLNCENNQLSTLDLTNCSQLIEFYFSQNQLTHLTFPPELPNLEKLLCSENFLTDLDWATPNGKKLTVLNLVNNNFASRDLSCLAKFTNLKELRLGTIDQAKIRKGIYNRWTGSLQPLQNMKQLHTLHITNTDIESGIEYLPASVMEICCSYFLRPSSKVKLISEELEKVDDFMLTDSSIELYLKKKLPLEILKQIKDFNQEIIKQLKDFNHKNLTPEQGKLLVELIPSKEWREHYRMNGLCFNCWQLNGDRTWCQSCNLPRLQVNFAHWTSGDKDIDKLIQKSQLETRNGHNLLEWIPYEQFSNIEFLAEGGFSKVYKAEWIGGPIKGWNVKNSKLERWGRIDVVLKILTNSQNMTTDFFQEILNHKLVARDRYSFIVGCYGISQNSETGNYVMVMSYKPEGNLRQFLQSNYQQLSFSDRFHQLFSITQGLQSIHQQGLVHHDFHAGNILQMRNDNFINSNITDLGLSRPVQETNKDKVYGVLPYVAPEVLCGKKYTQASDIYSLGMIAYELFSNQPPLAEYTHDFDLALQICKGLRPNLQEVIAPQLLKDLISRCWDAIPEQRPTAGEIFSTLRSWLDDNFFLKKYTKFYHQYQELLATDVFSALTNKTPRNYSTKKYTSRRLDFHNLPKPQNSQELNEQFCNTRQFDLSLDLTGLSISEDPQEESSTQVQIQIPLKNNLN